MRKAGNQEEPIRAFSCIPAFLRSSGPRRAQWLRRFPPFDLEPSVGFAASLRALSAAMLVVARAGNRPVYLFTPNTPAELSVALTVGVDGVITDHPDVALDLRRHLLPS